MHLRFLLQALALRDAAPCHNFEFEGQAIFVPRGPGKDRESLRLISARGPAVVHNGKLASQPQPRRLAASRRRNRLLELRVFG